MNMLKDRAKWILHWNFDSLILSCHTWNILKKCPSWIFTACRSDWYNSWEYFMFDNSELSCQNFIGEFILPYLRIDPNSITHTVQLQSDFLPTQEGICHYISFA